MYEEDQGAQEVKKAKGGTRKTRRPPHRRMGTNAGRRIASLLLLLAGLLLSSKARGQEALTCNYRGLPATLSQVATDCCGGDAEAELGSEECGLPGECSAACARTFLDFHDGPCYMSIGLLHEELDTFDAFADMCRCPPPCICPRDVLQQRLDAAAGACFGGGRRAQSGAVASGPFAGRRFVRTPIYARHYMTVLQ